GGGGGCDDQMAAMEEPRLARSAPDRRTPGPHTSRGPRRAKGKAAKDPDAINAPGLLRPRRERPRSRPAEKRDELAALHVCAHSITSSARARMPAGNSIPIALAVLRLTTSSNFAACSTGRSSALGPLKLVTTWAARGGYRVGKWTEEELSPPAST